ncbi:obg-like ATPase 1 [Syzygium oleosum]|uniref:obg-like ATPase 1 n=1 Tax=Syzygium oleosum TaxID=219896 RepID=UPI0024B8EA40|nr:obg-like ATPase 1 [Syzygium oleosum]
MPPKASKSKETPAESPILGRFSSHLKIGIVGLPNVGKSTLFNVLTKLAIPAQSFPFCTIEPNEARLNIPDERFEWLCNLFKPKSEVPAFLEIHDIAGLVRGAHQGLGLGNSFLSHIRAVDVIFHVLRAFEDPDIIHVDDSVDPVRDLEVTSAELRLKVSSFKYGPYRLLYFPVNYAVLEDWIFAMGMMSFGLPGSCNHNDACIVSWEERILLQNNFIGVVTPIEKSFTRHDIQYLT